MSFKWLDRRTAAPGPFLTLVRSEADYKKAMRHCKIPHAGVPWIASPHADATTHILNGKSGALCAIVALRADKQAAVEIAGLLVHEAVHVAQHYFDWYGETQPAKEQQAYCIQGIAQELMAEYARQIGEKK